MIKGDSQEKVFKFGDKVYDRCIEATDWRFSAAIVGMQRYLEYQKLSYYQQGRRFYYNYADIEPVKADEKFLDFIESFFAEQMHHKNVEIEIAYLISKLKERENLDKKVCELSDITEKEKEEINEKYNQYHNEISKIIKGINSLLIANKIMKELFREFKISDNISSEEIINKREKIFYIINENRHKIIRSTFFNGNSGFKKFIASGNNDGNLRSMPHETCRILGFHVDKDRKTRNLGFAFNEKTRSSIDIVEFDFIPIAFSKGEDSIFINNNSSISELINANDKLRTFLEKKKNNRVRIEKQALYYAIAKSGEYLENNTEIILKNTNTDYYETVMLRKESIDILKLLLNDNKMGLRRDLIDSIANRYVEIRKEYKVSIGKELANAIIDMRTLDEIICQIFKYERNVTSKDEERKRWANESFLVRQLIRINQLIYTYNNQKENKMEENYNKKNRDYLEIAFNTALDVSKRIEEIEGEKENKTKVRSYKNKLINTMISNNNERFFEIMLQLSSYAEVQFSFLHPLLKDFDNNKNIAYSFINGLQSTQNKKDKKENTELRESKEGE